MSSGASTVAGTVKAVARLQRVENGLIAVAIIAAVVLTGLPWWVLVASFLLFDLSALGYLRDVRVGAMGYNLVHNYAVPAILIIGYVVLRASGVDAEWLVLLAASWGFHVGVDRALGYGLKLGSFQETHLGPIGPARQQ